VSANELPEPVSRLLADYAGSPKELGVLLALIESDSRWWDARSLARKSDVSVREAARMLEAFASRNLLDIRMSDDVRYRLCPGTPDLERKIHLLIDIYRRSPSLVHRWAGRFA
jgi:DNA-binding MarR family transcriptional regulator